MSNFPILILAAGQSRRMRGRDKLMEVVEGQPLIRRQAEMALPDPQEFEALFDPLLLW